MAGVAGRWFVGMSDFLSHSYFLLTCHQGNKKSHPSADFGDAASSPLFSQTPYKATSVWSHPRELTLSPQCSHADLRSGPNCSLKRKTRWESNIREHESIPPTPFTAGVMARGPRHLSPQLVFWLTKAASVGSTSPRTLSRREPELFLAWMIQHKEAFIAQQQASRASSHHASSQVLDTRGHKFLQTPDSVNSPNIRL